MSRAVPFSGRAAATLSSTTYKSPKAPADSVNRYLRNLRLRTSTSRADHHGVGVGCVDRARPESLAYLRLKPRSLVHIRSASTASAVRVNDEEEIQDWYDWNHNYQLPAYVDPYIPYAFSSDHDRARRHEIDGMTVDPIVAEPRASRKDTVAMGESIVNEDSSNRQENTESTEETSHPTKMSWESILVALQLDTKAGSLALNNCMKEDAYATIHLAEARATIKEWIKIRDMSSEALYYLRSKRKSALLWESATPLRFLQVLALIHVGDTSKALGLLYRLLSETAARTTSRYVLSHLPMAIQRLSEREQPSDVLAALAPLFGKRQALGWNLAPPLRSAMMQLSTSVGDPIAWLHQQLKKVEKVPRIGKRQTLERGIAELILFAILDNASVRTLTNLYDEINRLGIVLSNSALASLSSKFARADERGKALAIYATMDIAREMDNATFIKVIAMLHDLDMISKAALLLAKNPIHVGMKLFLDTMSYSVKHQQNDVAMRMISRHFPRLPEAISGKVMTTDFSKREQKVLKRLFYSYLAIEDLEQADLVMQTLVTQGVRTRSMHYNTLLKAFTARRDVESSNRIISQMRQRDGITYSTLMSLYMNQKDTAAVQRAFDEMQQTGIVPDAVAFAILLNAHIEAGDWIEASTIWQNLPQHIQTDHSIVNTLLKGMVLLSAPFQEVYRLFTSAFPEPSQADRISWTILIQSACDGGNLARARELYLDFKLLARQGNPALRLDHFISSILVVGHIRHGEIATAQELYDDMQREGVMNTSVTYAAIIDAALKGRWPMSASKAKELGYRLLAESTTVQREPYKGRGQPVENIVVPLIRSAIRNGDTEEIERLFQLVLEKDLRPSLSLYAMLLDAYRQAGEIDHVQQVWDAIYTLALEQKASSGPVGTNGVSGRDCRLCIPLSIYIDAMSTAGRHQDILRVWSDLRQHGFGFDAHNWNHLAVALIRSGDVLRAFDIVENVLIKRQEELSSRRFAAIRTTDEHEKMSALDPIIGGSASPLEEHLLLDPTQRPPNRRHEFRQDAVSYHALRKERLSAGDSLPDPSGLHFDPNIFERWRPTDVMWRPAYLTVAVLDRTYSDLEKGRSMMALIAAEEEDGEAERESASGEAQSRQGSPMALLTKINSKYAKTVALIMLHRRKRKDGHTIGERSVKGDA